MAGAVYPNVNTNPFFPAVTANTSFAANGYSAPAGANTANDIFAGSYTHVETGAIEPGTAGGNTHDYRYVIQNDLKWTYATNPFAPTSTASTSEYRTPQAAAFRETYTGYTTQGRNATWDYIYDETAADSKGSATNTTVLTPTNGTAGTCSADGHIHSGTNTNQYTTYAKLSLIHI